MIRLTLKQNTDDNDMIELWDVTRMGRKVLWGVVHSDFVYEDEWIRDHLKAGESISVQLVVKPE